MPKFLCKACGIQYSESTAPPSQCIVCEDGRQFVPRAGQGWTTPEKLANRHFNAFRKIGPELFALSTMPRFGIGQRAFLIITPSGNVLWDCISFLDSATIEIIRLLGGLKAIAISHPHFYSAMATWGQTFECPVFVNDADRQWVVDPDPCVEFWTANRKIFSLESPFTGWAATSLEVLFCFGPIGGRCSRVTRYWSRRMGNMCRLCGRTRTTSRYRQPR